MEEKVNAPHRYWDTEQQRWVYPGELPPLPEGRVLTGDNSLWVESEPSRSAFTADQMREYGELCARMAREEAAKVCEDLAASNTDIDNWDSGFRVAAAECAAAIRSGK